MSLRQFAHYHADQHGEQDPPRRDIKRATNRLDRRQDKAVLRNLKGARFR